MEKIDKNKEVLWELAEELMPWKKASNNQETKEETEPAWKVTHREMSIIMKQRNLEWYYQ